MTFQDVIITYVFRKFYLNFERNNLISLSDYFPFLNNHYVKIFKNLKSQFISYIWEGCSFIISCLYESEPEEKKRGHYLELIIKYFYQFRNSFTISYFCWYKWKQFFSLQSVSRLYITWFKNKYGIWQYSIF